MVVVMGGNFKPQRLNIININDEEMYISAFK